MFSFEYCIFAGRIMSYQSYVIRIDVPVPTTALYDVIM